MGVKVGVSTIELEGFVDATRGESKGSGLVYLVKPVPRRAEISKFDLDPFLERLGLELSETGQIGRDEDEEAPGGTVMLESIFAGARAGWRRGKKKTPKDDHLYFCVVMEYTIDPSAPCPFALSSFEGDEPLTVGLSLIAGAKS